MKVTIELSDADAEQLRKEAAALGPLTRIETLAAYYLRFGLRQWHSLQHEGERARAELESFAEQAPPPGAPSGGA